MTEITRIAIDTSKSVFTLHGVDAQGQRRLRRNLRRSELLAFFEQQPAVEVVLEACGGSHYWGRVLGRLGHRVRLIPAQYSRSSSAARTTETMPRRSAWQRDSRACVAVKSAADQARAMLLTTRELLVRQRTQLVNALRGHAAELGLVAKLGNKGVAQLQAEIAAAAEAMVPAEAPEALTMLGREIARIEARLAEIDAKVIKQHKANPLSQRLAGIPGVGPIGALNFALRVDPTQFKSGRHFAAWLGLVPQERSTGGKQRLGGISRAGDERLRQLLVLGATSVIRHAKPGRKATSRWLLDLLKRRPRKLVAVAPRLRRGKPGQQDGPDHLGHDDARRDLPATDAGGRLTRA